MNLIKKEINKPEFQKGKSSLLFIISTLFAITYSDLFFWRFGNILLIGTSYFCNAYNTEVLKTLDYLCIMFLNMACINSSYINIFLFYLLMIESTLYSKINASVQCSMLTGLSIGVYRTYLYCPDVAIFGVPVCIVIPFVYNFRNYIYYRECETLNFVENPHIYTSNDFFYIWHICIVTILCISSLTSQSKLTVFNEYILSDITLVILIYTGLLGSVVYKLVKNNLILFNYDHNNYTKGNEKT